MSGCVAKVDTNAFDLVPPGYDGRAVALCLHGLTGSPYEMRPIAEALVRRGVRAVAPVMAGHDDRSANELAKTPYTAWINHARDHLRKLSTETEQVFIAGMSMGGLVTLVLAAENLASCAAVMGAPLRLRPMIRALVPLMKQFRPYLKNEEGADIQNEEARARHPAFDAMPAASIHEVIKLQKVARSVLPRIIMPVFVGHGARDHTADPSDARTIFGAVNAGERALFIGANSGHVISVDNDGPQISNSIAHFFEGQLEPR